MIKAGTFTGNSRVASVRCVDFDVVVMGCHLLVPENVVES
jgi:hypothetical protein